ncbi:MAG TPA: hypothetical protein VKF36_20110 [Syntrophorhabdales bacterium]|nr:hypothetical protein [Syntrophorhabdales bacterium]
MTLEKAIVLSGRVMTEFASLTGLSPVSGSPRRYLWTDAFAVCNFLGLYRQTGEVKFKDLALQLVSQVHNVLGRHRPDDSRTGSLSGLDEREGELHPTVGGLRIGKKLKERKPKDPLNERMEWDRDGQYYHYLTKWMHALNCVTRVTGDFTYNRWALELAKTAHAAFVYTPSSGGNKRMYWKMSIDLSHPLVRSMGLHDPLDGLITYTQVQATAAEDSQPSRGDLSAEIADMAGMCKGRSWATDDPLGIGGLLSDTFRVAQLMTKGYFTGTGLLVTLLESSLAGLEAFGGEDGLGLPADSRLAFRELGLSIGLKAAEPLRGLVEGNQQTFAKEGELKEPMDSLKEYESVADVIERFWLEPEHQKAASWTEHRDINMVMLATCLDPDGYLAV